MKSMTLVLALAAATVFSATSPIAAKTCKSDYYTGEASGRTWETGERNAHGVWSHTVRGHLGKRWSYWSKANVRDESCDPISAALQWCKVEAYPCK